MNDDADGVLYVVVDWTTLMLMAVCHHPTAVMWTHLITRSLADLQWRPPNKMSDLPHPTVDRSATCRRAVPPAGVSGCRTRMSGWVSVDRVLLIRWTRGSVRQSRVWWVLASLELILGTVAPPGDQQTTLDLAMNTVCWLFCFRYWTHCDTLLDTGHTRWLQCLGQLSLLPSVGW